MATAFGPLSVTSNLDRLAARGISFDLAYCNQAVCAPSRSNLMLGARSSSTGLCTLGLNFRQAYPDALTLPQYFGQHGYRTAGVGKVYHVGHGNTDDAASWTEPYHFRIRRRLRARGKQRRAAHAGGAGGGKNLHKGSSYGTGWANASNTPFRRYKAKLYEGGIATPLIVHWPDGLKTQPGSLTQAKGYLTDMMPTFLEVAGASYPTEYKGNKITPL